MADLSKIRLPSGSEYNIKDAYARQQIEVITGTSSGAMHYAGVTTTAIADGSTTNPITIDTQQYTAVAGDVVIYGNKEYIFSDTDNKWHEFGSTGSLKALAFKDTATANYTPKGTVTKPNFQGQESTVDITATEANNGTFQVGGTVGVPQFTGGEMTSTGTFAATGNVTITQETTGTTNFKPAGTVSKPNISVNTAGTTTTIKNPKTINTVANAVTVAAPSSTDHPDNNLVYYSVSGETLSLYQIGYSTTAAITTENETVKTGDASYQLASDPIFTGTDTVISASFTGTNKTVTVKGTTVGSNSAPSFTGKKYNLSGTTTAAGSVSQPTFQGTAEDITVS